MGETIAETRVEVDALREDLESQADALKARLRGLLDPRTLIRENPLPALAFAAGTAFLVMGGPSRLARAVRRRVRPTAPKQAYDALPGSLKAWIDTMAGGRGARTAEARYALAEELLAWRHNATKSRKARRELAKAITQGPPGPERAIWISIETGLTLLTAALARRAIQRLLNGPPSPSGMTPSDEASSAPPATGPGPREYSGFSTIARRANGS